MSINDRKTNEIPQQIVSQIKVEQVSTSSRFNLPAFSFLVCFGLLMANWWPDINGTASMLISICLAGFISLFGWILIALLLKFAISLPLNTVAHSSPVAAFSYLISFGLLVHYWISPGDDVLSILLTMAISAVVAIPCCLVLLLPARILFKFLSDLFGKKR